MSSRAMSLPPIIEILAVQMGGVCSAMIEEILAVCRGQRCKLVAYFSYPFRDI
jgi:hypothetical protein